MSRFSAPFLKPPPGQPKQPGSPARSGTRRTWPKRCSQPSATQARSANWPCCKHTRNWAPGNPWQDFRRANRPAAGLQREQREQAALLADLNRRYRDKFGFPFILAVKGLDPDKIITRFRERLENDPDDEFNECLEQVFRIAAFRLEDLLGGFGGG